MTVRPLAFIACNGLFLALAWVAGLLQATESSEGYLRTLRVGTFAVAYMAYIAIFAFYWLKLEKNLKLLCRISDNIYSDM